MIKTRLNGTIISIDEWKKTKSFKKRIFWEYVSNIPIWLIAFIVISLLTSLTGLII